MSLEICTCWLILLPFTLAGSFPRVFGHFFKLWDNVQFNLIFLESSELNWGCFSQKYLFSWKKGIYCLGTWSPLLGTDLRNVSFSFPTLWWIQIVSYDICYHSLVWFYFFIKLFIFWEFFLVFHLHSNLMSTDISMH